MNSKQIAADKAVEYVENGMIVGLGTGSTAYWAIQKIGLKVKEGLQIRTIATSKQSENLARELAIPITSFAEINHIDITIDGADEVDSNLQLIKGGGGALLREKIVAAASSKFIIVADESKLVNHLGKFPLPVEVIPFGFEITTKSLEKLGCTSKLRLSEGKPYITDNGNYILDCNFEVITKPEELHSQLNLIPGVVENGLFVNMASTVIVGYGNGTIQVLDKA